MTWIILGGLTAWVAIWVVWLRPWLRTRPWAQRFFAWIEPMEIIFWQKSETILWARFMQLLGAVSSALIFIGTLDLTPLYAVLPVRYQWIIPLAPLAISVVGRVEEVLRRDTTKPLIEVAASTATLEKVADKVEQAQVAKAEVVAAIVNEEVKAAEVPPPPPRSQ